MAATLSQRLDLMMPIAKRRKQAMFCGPWPVRKVQRSSSQSQASRTPPGTTRWGCKAIVSTHAGEPAPAHSTKPVTRLPDRIARYVADSHWKIVYIPGLSTKTQCDCPIRSIQALPVAIVQHRSDQIAREVLRLPAMDSSGERRTPDGIDGSPKAAHRITCASTSMLVPLCAARNRSALG